MVITHNMMALNAMNYFGNTNKNVKKSTEKLSSGFQINRAADDAAGLSISEKMRNQIRNLNQGTKNIEDGISFVQTADGALSEIHGIIHRMEELSVQAANDTYNEDDRLCIDDEIRELKQEIKKVFRKTEFNTKNIFSAPYIPTIEGQPNDLQVFTTDDNRYGGITVNNIRYTWEEIKQLSGKDILADDGIHFRGGRYSFQTYDGEDVTIDTHIGQAPPYVSRLYRWHATDTGMYVNNVLACKWEDMGLDKHNIQSNEYTFSFHGMDISFEVPSEDDRILMSDFMKKINNDGFSSGVSWSAASLYSLSESAVTITNSSNRLTVKDSWKALTDNNSHDLVLQTSDAGVTLYVKDKDGKLKRLNGQADNSTTPDMQWSAFSSIVPGEDGKYPIIDWGTSVQTPINSPSQITLDYDAVYRFKEPTTGMYFEFKLADEASLTEVKQGLTTEVSTSFRAPVKTSYDDSGVALSSSDKSHFSVSEASTNFAYDLQRDTGKSFNNWNSTAFNTDFSVAYSSTTNRVDFTYEIKNTSGTTIHTLKRSVNYNTFYNAVIRGGTQLINMMSYGDYGSNTEFAFKTDSFNSTVTDTMRQSWNNYADSEAQVYATAAQTDKIQELYTSKLEAYLTRNGIDSSSTAEQRAQAEETFRQTEWTDFQTTESYRTAISTAYNKAYVERHDNAFYEARGRDQDKYVDNAIKYLQGLSLTTKQTAQPTITTAVAARPNESKHTGFGGVVLNPPMKGMYVQSGANSGEDIYIEWPTMTLSSIGIGGASAKTREEAVGTIAQVKTAINLVSSVRSRFGAYQNRLTYEANNNQNYGENLTYAESQIRDTDMADEMLSLTKSNILSQAAQSMLAQANQSTQGILGLLQ